MKNGKKIGAFIMILGSTNVTSRGFFELLTRSNQVSTDGAKKPDENFPEKLQFHLEAHRRQVMKTIPSSFQRIPPTADLLTEHNTTNGETNTATDENPGSTENNSLSPEEEKALLKLNRRSIFSFFRKKLPSGEKGLAQQNQFTKSINNFIKILIKKLLIDPKYKITAKDLQIFKNETLTKEDLELVERTINTVKDYVADVAEYYKIILKAKEVPNNNRKHSHDPESTTKFFDAKYEKDLEEKIKSLSKKLGYKYTAIFHKVLEIVNEEAEAYKNLDAINTELNEMKPHNIYDPKNINYLERKIEKLQQDPSKSKEVEELNKKLDELYAKHNKLLKDGRAQEKVIQELWLKF